MSENYFAHPTAIVDDGAAIGDGTKIWHWVHVCSDARIGEGCVLGQNVFVSSDVVIGNRVKIQNNVSVYDGVRLEDEVFCGPSVVFTNVYNPRAGVEKKSEFRSTIVRRGATLGANTTIVCGIEIGEFAMAGAGSVLREDVPAHALMVGVPARQIGWVDEHGERIPLPASGTGVHTCERTGAVYSLSDRHLTKTPSASVQTG